MNIKSSILFLFFCWIYIPLSVTAQNLPVGSSFESYYKQLQLQGQLDSTLSFNIRPLAISYLKNAVNDTTQKNHSPVYLRKPSITSKLLVLNILPIRWEQQYNTHHPYGWNDGAMIPAKGYQTLISTGVYLKSGALSVQLQPEYIHAINADFITTGLIRSGTDQPEKFGTGVYSRFLWGQSNIQVQQGKFAAKLSTENIWWGPGTRNSLLMSNNADGFLHLSLQSVAPISTAIGSWEFQFLGGKLKNSYFDIAKRKEWRYLSGMHLSYQPKWTPGLFFGLTRSFQAYYSDVKRLAELLPFLTPYQKINTNDGDPISRDQLTSVYMRWLFEKSHAEIYFEFGKNDNAYNLIDFLGSPEHSRAYIFGLKKLFSLSKNNNYISFNGEITQMSQSLDRIVRPAGAWYYHSQVSQGFTNNGQVIGAGIGSGGNLQSVELSWINGFKQLGFRVERLVREKDYYDAAIGDYNTQNRNWIDFSFAAIGRWQYKRMTLNSELNYINSINYQWKRDDQLPSTNYLWSGKNQNNFSARIAINYSF
jgi:hypothetical protein